MTFLQKLKLRLISISPSYWVMVHRYDKKWDLLIKTMMDENVPVTPYIYATGEECDNYNVMMLNGKIWVACYPYSYAACYDLDIRPSRYTIARFKKYCDWWLENPPIKKKG